MTGAVATHSAATAPRERGWRWFVLAVLLVSVATAAPVWPPALALLAAIVRLLLPFEPLALLVLVPLAACAVVGWWSGGRTLIALLTVGIIGWALVRMPVPLTGFGTFVRGWALALSAAFGLVCLASGSRPFLGRALSAVALAAAVTALGIGARNEVDGPLVGAVRLLDQDYQRRLDESLADWRGRTESGVWQAFAARVPAVAARAEAFSSDLQQLQTDTAARNGSMLILLSPALLALESMLALALAWAAYHRLARARIGPPLGALRDLRFNDQLIWGLVVGVVLVLLPTLAEWRVAGLNLLCFFGALYALRGVAVASWLVPERWALPLLLLLLVLVSLLGPTLMLMSLAAVCFGVGLSDTWRDFRSRAHQS